jgi:uncharacterized membrane protein YwaF
MSVRTCDVDSAEMDSSSNFEVSLTAIVLLAVLVLVIRAAIKTRRRRRRAILLAFAILLSAVMLWNTAQAVIG